MAKAEIIEGSDKSLQELLGAEYYNELQLKSVVERAAKGDFMPSLHTWLKQTRPDYNWSWLYMKYLIDCLQDLSDGKIRKLMISLPPRSGKECADSTPVLTPSGWTTHGELNVGDYVYHPSGKPARVIAVSEKLPCDSSIMFSSGEVIKTHSNHEWKIYSRYTKDWRIVETKWLSGINKLKNKRVLYDGNLGKRGCHYVYKVENISALENSEKDLIVPPYVLGAWLGDGTSDAPNMTYDIKDSIVIETFEKYGYIKTSGGIHKITGVYSAYFGMSKDGKSLWSDLKEIGVSRNKHIPNIYKRGSIQQRLELLAGIIDTDGTVDKNGRVTISTCMPTLKDDIYEIALTLGFRPYIQVRPPELSSSGIQGKKDVYTIGFNPTMDIPTVIPRKKITRLVRQRLVSITGIQEISDGELGNCIQVDSPDGMYLVGKTLIPTHNSTLCSIHFPVYFLEKNPENRVIIGTYNQTLANKMSRGVRTIAKTKMRLNADRKAMEEWETEVGGGVRAVGVGAGIAGIGANLIILDDVVRSRKDASSITVRNSTYAWYTDDIYTRMEPDSRILIIMTRWHEDDLIGRIQRLENDWTVINLPAIAEDNDPLGRKPGEALNPERYPIEKLYEIRKVLGRSFNALYQGRPTEQEGEIFKASWFREHMIKSLPQYDQHGRKHRYEFVRYWDKAATEKKGDYTVGVLMCRDRVTKTYYILDVVRGQWESVERDRIMLETAAKDQAAYRNIGTVRICHEQEPGSAGKDAKNYTNKLLSGFAVKAVKVTGNKKLRAEPYASQCEAGNVYMMQADWNEDFIDEHAVFDNGAHDDMVDAASGAFNQLSKGSGFISLGQGLLGE